MGNEGVFSPEVFHDTQLRSWERRKLIPAHTESQHEKKQRKCLSDRFL